MVNFQQILRRSLMLLMIFFVNIGVSLNSLAPQSNINFRQYLPQPDPTSLFMSPVTDNKICNIVKAFKNHKAPGLDECSPKIIKAVIDLICKPLSHLPVFNLSISTGKFPDKMKLASITSIFKSRVKEQVSNYRPISVLSVFSKILECIIYNRTYSFLEKHNCLFVN